MKKYSVAAILISLMILAIVLVLIGAPRRGHVTLLTFADETQSGGTADLYLEIRPGTGAIFIDSFPLTRLDTQSSTRYANQVACDFVHQDCSRYDFFYTIRANSAIVGGPSAGAAIATLTAALLDGRHVREDIAMTGTINSGGIVGPVAGVAEKIEGAKLAGKDLVLIPTLGAYNNTNASCQECEARAKSIAHPEGIEVRKVGTLAEALEIFTGKHYVKELPPLVVPEAYERRMTLVADDICARTRTMRAQIETEGLPYNDTANYTQRIAALADGAAYSRASLCFSQNLEFAALLLNRSSSEDLRTLRSDVLKEAEHLSTELASEDLKTISDLEVYSIVQERLAETISIIGKLDVRDPDPAQLAYAQERLLSAKSWTVFFGMPGQEYQIDEDYLHRTCLSKISEAEERINYVRFYAPSLVTGADETLTHALSQTQSDPVLCIFGASKAKAQANLLSSAITVDEGNVDKLVEEKLVAADTTLRAQSQQEFFPILGYSYYRYAQDLRADAPYSALTFAEYALELSTLDMYFPKKDGFHVPMGLYGWIGVFLFGIVFGAATVGLLSQKPRRKR